MNVSFNNNFIQTILNYGGGCITNDQLGSFKLSKLSHGTLLLLLSLNDATTPWSSTLTNNLKSLKNNN